MPADTRLNHYAARRRDGRAEHEPRQRDHLAAARFAMDVFAWWWVTRRERGWPSESSELRALQSKQATTDTTGDARWKGVGDPPRMPKETRSAHGGRIPDIDRARMGPRVLTLLLAFQDIGGERYIQVMVAEHFWPGKMHERARKLDMAVKTYQTYYREGLSWLAGRLEGA